MGRVGGRQNHEKPQPTSKRASVFDSSSSDDSHGGHSPAPFPPSAPPQHVEPESDDSDRYEASHEPPVQSPPVPFPPIATPHKAHKSSLDDNEVPHENSPVKFPPNGPATDVGEGQRSPSVHSPTLFVGYSWTTGLFDCHEHPTNALFTAFLPCVTFGQIVEILEGGDASCALGSLMYLLMAPVLCSQWIMATTYRTRLRKRYNLVQAPTEDWIAHLCCPFCALCQEFRELRNRGIDPSLGWLGNLAQQNGIQQQSRTTPPVNQSMTR